MSRSEETDQEGELLAFKDQIKTIQPQSTRISAHVPILHALAGWEAAQLQDASSMRIEVATNRLATFTNWLMVATSVLAAATVALVIATAVN